LRGECLPHEMEILITKRFDNQRAFTHHRLDSLPRPYPRALEGKEKVLS
jgi:hypothetical protein